MPKNAGIIRYHVGGDVKTKEYFKCLLEVARRNPTILFYLYTKALPFVVALKSEIDKLPNFIITASYGGWRDDLILKHNLRSVKVVHSVYEARKLGLPIDHNDNFAANPLKKNISYALLIHSPQKAGSSWGKAVRKLKGKGSYGKNS